MINKKRSDTEMKKKEFIVGQLAFNDIVENDNSTCRTRVVKIRAPLLAVSDSYMVYMVENASGELEAVYSDALRHFPDSFQSALRSI